MENTFYKRIESHLVGFVMDSVCIASKHSFSPRRPRSSSITSTPCCSLGCLVQPKMGSLLNNQIPYFRRYDWWLSLKKVRHDNWVVDYNVVNNYKTVSISPARPTRTLHLAHHCFFSYLATMWQTTSEHADSSGSPRGRLAPSLTYRIWKTPLCLPRPSQPHLAPLLRSWLRSLVRK